VIMIPNAAINPRINCTGLKSKLEGKEFLGGGIRESC